MLLLRSLRPVQQGFEAVSCLQSQCASALSTCTGVWHSVGQQQLQQDTQQEHYWRPCSDRAQRESQCHLQFQHAGSQFTPQLLPLAARPFSSSSCQAAGNDTTTQQQQADASKSLSQPEKGPQRSKKERPGLPGSLICQPLFWNKLSSKIHSRKPAIRFPARHQWRYCAEDYDPMEKFEARPLPPYAPLRAHTKDYNKILQQTMPKFHRNSYRRLWRKNLAIADQRWRKAWEAKLAAERKKEEIVRKMSARIVRERSWQVWQLQQQLAQEQQGQQQQQGRQQQRLPQPQLQAAEQQS